MDIREVRGRERVRKKDLRKKIAEQFCENFPHMSVPELQKTRKGYENMLRMHELGKKEGKEKAEEGIAVCLDRIRRIDEELRKRER